MIQKRRSAWSLSALALIAVGVIALAITTIGPPTSSTRTSTEVVTAARGVVQSTVTGSGSIAAGVDDAANFGTSGTLQHVYVKVGDHVNKGDLLATLDTTAAQLTLDQAEESLSAAELNLTAVETGASRGSGGSGSGGSGSSTGGSATQTSTPLQSTTEFVSYQPTRGTSGSGKRGGSQAPTGTTTTTPTATTPPATPPTTRTTPATTTTRASAPSGRSGSTGSSGGSGSSAQTTTTNPYTTEANKASAQASVYSAEANVRNAKTALEATHLYAPTSGTVVSLANIAVGQTVSAGQNSSSASSSSSNSSSTGSTESNSSGSLGGSSSSSSSSSSNFIEIVNTHKMTMTVPFDESDISKLKVGQSANVTLDALTDVELAASVSAISTVATTSSSVVSYDVTLTLNQRDSRVKPGMSASASVIVNQAHGVTVPNDAITGSGSLSTVQVLDNGKTTQKEVVVGLKGDSRTLIVSGLSAGEQLVVRTTLPSLGTSSSSSSSSSGTLGGGGLGGGGAIPGGGGAFPGGGARFFRGGGGP